MNRAAVAGLGPSDLRAHLGDDLSHALPERVTERLAVDVLVVDLAGDGYTLVVGERSVIVVKRTPSWFRQNFSIAHELGHLAVASLCNGQLHSEDPAETAANQFAAELLMPESQVRSLDWAHIALPVLAERLWHWGVSTQALEVRLKALKITPSQEVTDAMACKTQGFLRRYWSMPQGPDPITQRMERAAERRLPTELISKLESAVVEGRAPARSLAFALGVTEDDLEIDLTPVADPAEDVRLLDGLT